MLIKKINEVVCDMEGCNNLAKRQVLFSENSKIGLRLCDHCLKNLYDLMDKNVRVKGGKNVQK